MGNPQVFFDIAADGKPLGRIVMEVKCDDNVSIDILLQNIQLVSYNCQSAGLGGTAGHDGDGE